MKKALIFGPIYAPPNELPQTGNDVANYVTTLAARGFTSIQVKTGTITRTSFITWLNSFVSGLRAGDAAVIVILGHGARIPGSEPDGYDECWVSTDIWAIRDHEIGAILARARSGTKIDVVSEFCFSGTSTDNNNVRTWCACGPAESAWWGYSGGLAYSIFSLYLCWSLRNFPSEIASQLIARVRGYVQAIVSNQTPELNGNAVLQAQIPF